MKPPIAIFLVLFAAACDDVSAIEPVPAYEGPDVLRVLVFGHNRVSPLETMPAEVAAAGDLLGVPLELTGDFRGAVEIQLLDVDVIHPIDGYQGHARNWECSRVIRVAYDDIAIAHEIGHAVGLEHADQGNVMHENFGSIGGIVTDAQQQLAWDGMVDFNDECAPR